ncbi:hypothetical protein AVM48_18825 [Acinetobacter baumannii]|nr:hypothetical protein AVM48_18825 [Acinetobacter baumannii]
MLHLKNINFFLLYNFSGTKKADFVKVGFAKKIVNLVKGDEKIHKVYGVNREWMNNRQQKTHSMSGFC